MKIAVPAFNCTVAITFVPLKKVTKPVGPPGALEVTFAVNCTLSPNVDGFGLELIEVVEGTPTTCDTDAELRLKSRLPA